MNSRGGDAAPLTIFFSFHATSVDNEAGRASGHADIPLSPAGRAQAAEMARWYADEPLDAVYCSDLQRATETERIAFAARGLPLTLDARLREFDYGQMTQAPREQVEDEFPRRVTEPFPGGESLVMVAERMRDFLREVAARHAGGRILVIGHRATKWGLDYWAGAAAGAPDSAQGGAQTLRALAEAPWEWRDIPVWRYTLAPRRLQRPIVAG